MTQMQVLKTAQRRSARHVESTTTLETGALVTQHAVLRCGDVSTAPDLVVAIPVCNESERITACVAALSETLTRYPQAGVVLMVNNSDDGSAQTAHRAMRACGITGIVVDASFASSIATAGWARRLALEIAAGWARKDAVLMTTDADSRVAPDWAAANLSLLEEGAHLVCGRIAADAEEAAQLPASIVPSDTLESLYTDLSIELDARLDPRPHDPWPHHGLASGASLAIRAADYRLIGGMPPLPCSEDRAFAALVERHDLLVRHSDAPLVTVSCRLEGRACGGMADAISARIADPDSFADQRLLPAAMTARKASLRKALRQVWQEKGDIHKMLCQFDLIHKSRLQKCANQTFGAFWADVESNTKTLTAPRMRPSDLARELPALRQLVAQARRSA